MGLYYKESSDILDLSLPRFSSLIINNLTKNQQNKISDTSLDCKISKNKEKYGFYADFIFLILVLRTFYEK